MTEPSTKPQERPNNVRDVNKLLKPVEPQATVDELLEKTRPRQSVDGLIARWKEDAPPVLASFDCATDEGRVLTSACMGKSDAEMDAYVGKELRVVNFMAHDVTIASMADGELEDMIRWVLILDDGTTVSTCSKSFADTFRVSARLVGPGPWAPPLRFEARKQLSKNGRKYFECRELLRGGKSKNKSK